MFGFHSCTSSDASDIFNWSCNSGDEVAMLLHSNLLHATKPKQPTVKFSKVLIVNDSTTAYIMKDLTGSTKNVIDRYYSN